MNYIFLRLVTSVVRLFQFLLFARAIFSWFPQMQQSKIAEFLYFATEPLIMPFRSLLNKVESLRMMPIDISFLLAFFALEAAQSILYSLV